MVRVLIAEDSTTVRALLGSILESDPAISIVGEAVNGEEAVEMTARLRPDIVTMDVNMPLLNGLDATKEIMAATPTPIVIVSASAHDPEVGLALSATRAGALMVLPTPVGPDHPDFEKCVREFVSDLKAMSEVKVVRHRAVRSAAAVTRRSKAPPPEILLIAASTGGPAALHRVLSGLPRDFPVPIVIVQHIADGFMDGLCTWLNGSCNLRVKIAQDRERLSPRTVYLAPDDRHVIVHRGSLRLASTPALSGFRPSADPLFESAASVYGARLAALILTGMGSDGVAGLRAVHAAGGYVMAQDKASSIVFGMPREAARAGVVDVVLPLDAIPAHLLDLTRGSKYGH
ncbi:MAG: chemotaxis-specific protein-glutamate methyltransferase CheB [Gemmatimonadota bacterium]